MPKAVISNRIYMDLPENKKEIFDALTYRIVTGEGKYQNIEVVRNYKMVTPKIISIPQGRTDLIPKGYEISDKRVINFADFPDPKFDLFDEQKVVYDAVDSSCFVNALVGWGKTFTALHIARKLGQKTLVVVHTAALRDQWVKEVKNLFGFEPGTIGNGKFDLDAPIVIGNVQSIVLNLEIVSKEFGTLIMDEGHHVPATTFTSIIDSSHARYRIGLSGTMVRKDGKHVFFKDFFGDKVFKPPQNNTVNPTVYLFDTKMHLPPGKHWAEKINNLLYDPEYQKLIAILAAQQANMGHKVLVLADRTEFLVKVVEILGDRAVVITGATKDREIELDRVDRGEVEIVCGARQIFAEGLSRNILSCVILAGPIANAALLEQIIGRVMRKHPDKLEPSVIDLQFRGYTEKRQNSIRMALYFEKGWVVKAL